LKKRFFTPYLLVFYAVVFTLTSSLLNNSGFISHSNENALKNLVVELRQKEQKAKVLIQDIKRQLSQKQIVNNSFKSKDETISLYLYESDILKYWTVNDVPFGALEFFENKDRSIIKLKNGYYRQLRAQFKNKTIVALILIKKQYMFENKNLLSGFHTDYDFPFHAEIQVHKNNTNQIVNSENGDFLFSLDVKQPIEKPAKKLLLVVFLSLLGLLFFVWFCVKLLRKLTNKQSSIVSFIIIAGSLFFLRLLLLNYGFFSALNQLELFDPSIYATSFFFPTLGDFLINVLLLLFVSLLFARSLRSYDKTISGNRKSLMVIGLVVIILVFSIFIVNQIVSLIENSSISFQVNNFYGVTIYSIVGLLIIASLFLIYFITARAVVELIHKTGTDHKYFAINTLWVSFLLFCLIKLFVNQFSLLDYAWSPLIVLTISYSVYKKRKLLSFNSTIIILILFSFTSANIISKKTQEKEREKRLSFAEKLSSEEDALTELEYSHLQPTLKNSELLLYPFDTITVFDKTFFDKEIESRFFNAYWNNYDIKYYIYSTDGRSITAGSRSDENPEYRTIESVNSIISQYGKTSKINDEIIYVSNYYNKLSYLIKIPIKRGLNQFGHLVCFLKSKKIPEEIGFPELLIDKNTKTIEELVDYSYARYTNGKVVTALGDYSYSITPDDFENGNTQKHFSFQEGGYDHLVYNINEKSLLVLSKKKDNFLTTATGFSYLFTLFGLISLFVFAFKGFPKGVRNFNFTLENKMQLILVIIILVSIFLYGLGTRYYSINQYTRKNESIIREKIESVKTELVQKLKDEDRLDKNNKGLRNYLNGYILPKFSKVFFTEIILYDANGNLLASSRPKIFDTGLLSKKINPEAYHEMIEKKKRIFIHKEQIGELEYMSGYVPFFNKNNELLAYLNLPYILKQNEFQNEFSSFFEAIVNISVLLFALSILAALFASKWVTKPLRVLQTSLAGIELGKTNKPIQYTGNDEISELVNEYNKKVVELEKNAEQLAKSERESAWREMAKQVAHEIKNPLTPMKLRIQHMLRTFDEKDPEAKEKLNKVADSLIEQINSLSTIANEFSNFAKMPKPREGVFNIDDLLISFAELYGKSTEVELSYVNLTNNEAIVRSDKEQMLRVFNNLISNSIQAIPPNQKGIIEIRLTKEDGRFIVEVKDNGEGIPNNQKEKIFVPNFTTKSKGMGLGLAMVKNIVEAAAGHIWFTSKVNVGTSFYVSLPAYED